MRIVFAAAGNPNCVLLIFGIQAGIRNMIESVGRGNLHIEIDLGIETEGSYHCSVQAELIRAGNSVSAGIAPLSRSGWRISSRIQK